MKEGYDWAVYMEPIWIGAMVHYESVTFYPHPVTGKIEAAPLMYVPAKIRSVCSADLKTIYLEGLDYTVEGSMIQRTENSRIPVWDYDSYYPREPSSIPIECESVPGRYVLYDESGAYPAKQLAVTYECEKGGDLFQELLTLSPQECKTGRLPGLREKLQQRSPVNIVYYGDSVMACCDGSGMRNRAPFMPLYTEMVTEGLRRRFCHDGIREWNTAVGGTDTVWGMENAGARVSIHRPDLAVIGFGMNDAGRNMEPEDYERNNRRILELVRAECPDTEFLFVASILPNPECRGWTGWQKECQAVLEDIVGDTPGTALVPMRDIYLEVLKKKRYPDIQGNGVNHPNDFLYRIYAQAMLTALTQDGWLQE